MEPITSTYATYSQSLQDHKLMGTRCLACGEIAYPPRGVCLNCHSDQVEWIELPQRGKVVSFTTIFVGQSRWVAAGYDRDHPYATAVIELENGVRVSARLTGVDALHPKLDWIGRAAEVEFLTRGEEAVPVLAFRIQENST